MAAPPVARTFAAVETETAGFLNSVSTAVNFLLNPPRAKVVATVAQTFTTGVFAPVVYDTEGWDTDGIHSTVTNTSRLQATTSGLYVLVASTPFASNVTGVRQAEARKNAAGAPAGGTLIDGVHTVSSVANAQTIDYYAEVQMAAGDYVELFCLQSSGGNLATLVTAGTWSPWATFRWVASS